MLPLKVEGLSTYPVTVLPVTVYFEGIGGYVTVGFISVGGTSTSDYERGNYVNLTSTGSGYQIFKYPDFSFELVSYSIIINF